MTNSFHQPVDWYDKNDVNKQKLSANTNLSSEKSNLGAPPQNPPEPKTIDLTQDAENILALQNGPRMISSGQISKPSQSSPHFSEITTSVKLKGSKFYCDGIQCNKSFDDWESFTRHKIFCSHLNCALCGLAFRNFPHFSQHVQVWGSTFDLSPFLGNENL